MDFYILLGVERGATVSDIKRAYKRLARRFHPDINPGDRMAASQFRQIAEAYETLIDPDRRRQYDVGGTSTEPDVPFTVGFQGFDFSTTVSGQAASTFGDLFSDILRGPRGSPEAEERGSDLHQSVLLTFLEAMRGAQREVTATRLEHCRTCHGAGRVRMAERKCPACHGTGTLQAARGHMVFSRACQNCRGTGHLTDRLCGACNGQQTELRTEKVVVNVPPGLENGARLRIPGKGHAGRNGGPAGDLFIDVTVESDALYRREGDDLHLTVPVAIHEAALGARIEVPSIDGPVRLRIPPGSQSGQRFRLSDRGAPSPKTGRRGDLVIEVKIVLPKVLDERSKELLREFGKLHEQEDLRRELKGHEGYEGHKAEGHKGS